MVGQARLPHLGVIPADESCFHTALQETQGHPGCPLSFFLPTRPHMGESQIWRGKSRSARHDSKPQSVCGC